MYVFCNQMVQKNTMSTLVLKKPLFSPIWGHISVHKSEKSKFLAWIHMKYFHVGIFVIPRVCLIRKYGSWNTAFFSVFQCSSGCRGKKVFYLFELWLMMILLRPNHPSSLKWNLINNRFMSKTDTIKKLCLFKFEKSPIQLKLGNPFEIEYSRPSLFPELLIPRFPNSRFFFGDHPS